MDGILSRAGSFLKPMQVEVPSVEEFVTLLLFH
jgi:hypothetical protein